MENLKIGITERGDAGVDLSWSHKMQEVSGAILITKKITNSFGRALLAQEKPCILHVTCTGWGGTALEPNAYNYKQQINAAAALIAAGFPADRVVLRIDPIFPSEKGLQKVATVLEEFHNVLDPLGVKRIRFSIVDEYRHVKERYKKRGWQPLYGDNFSASKEQMTATYQLLSKFHQKYGYKFESCAERDIQAAPFIERCGCISAKDLELMKLEVPENMRVNPQNRGGCLCLGCKTELLEKRNPCKNGCIYCFWKQKGE